MRVAWKAGAFSGFSSLCSYVLAYSAVGRSWRLLEKGSNHQASSGGIQSLKAWQGDSRTRNIQYRLGVWRSSKSSCLDLRNTQINGTQVLHSALKAVIAGTFEDQVMVWQ